MFYKTSENFKQLVMGSYTGTDGKTQKRKERQKRVNN